MKKEKKFDVKLSLVKIEGMSQQIRENKVDSDINQKIQN